MAAKGRARGGKLRKTVSTQYWPIAKRRRKSSSRSGVGGRGRASSRMTRGRRPSAAGGAKNRRESYRLYICRVLEQVHPQMGISLRALNIMNSFMHDVFDRLATEAGRLADYSKRRTIKSREMQTAVRLILPGDLGRHAISEGTKAVHKFCNA